MTKDIADELFFFPPPLQKSPCPDGRAAWKVAKMIQETEYRIKEQVVQDELESLGVFSAIKDASVRGLTHLPRKIPLTEGQRHYLRRRGYQVYVSAEYSTADRLPCYLVEWLHG